MKINIKTPAKVHDENKYQISKSPGEEFTIFSCG